MADRYADIYLDNYGDTLSIAVTSGLSVTVNPGSVPPRMELDLEWAGAATATILRRDPDGRQWPVRRADPAILTGGVWSGFDYEAPYGVPVTYDVTSPEHTGEVLEVTTEPLVVPVEWQAALIHCGNPALSTPIRLHEGTLDTITSPTSRALHQVLGRRNPLALSDVRGAPEGQLVVWCQDLYERNALRDLLDDDTVLRLNVDPVLDYDVPQVYVSVGDLSVARWLPTIGPNRDRIVTLPFTEADRPAGGFQAIWSYDALDAAFTSYDAADAPYATYIDQSLNRRATGAGMWTYLAMRTDFGSYAESDHAFATYQDLRLNRRGL